MLSRPCISSLLTLAALALSFPSGGIVSAADDNAALLAKLDDGIRLDSDARYPVFVRMTAQLFKQGGDYEAFTQKHDGDPRSALRKTVLTTLKTNASASWKTVGPLVKKLADDGQISNVNRFWIVNGFSAEATSAACKQLAESDAVSFVYRPRGPLTRTTAQVRTPPPQLRKQMLEQGSQVYQSVLKDWKDDSHVPFQPEGLTIPWNLKRIRADVAWTQEKATGKGVVVALCDSGLMVAPALTAALWKNPRETLNGKDDDGNGRVDDLFGYDFAADSFYALGDSPRLPHGSMCGGIIAGRPINKKKLATAVAPRARLMVLRGMGRLDAYEYALENGADVISMSYMFIGTDYGNYRGVYRLAHEHLAAGGIVAVGGAGNFARYPEGRQIAIPKDIPCVIAAAGILEDGSLAPPSSRGPCFWKGVKFYDDFPPEQPLHKPDVTGCFGGYPVWGRPLAIGRRFKIVSKESAQTALVVGPQGNSFSGPHAAGVAALMLSVNPELTTWQVKSLMEQTCKDLGEKGRDTKFGAGLLQADAAVRAAKAARQGATE